MKALVVVAHPDDETLFLGGYILKNPDWEWTIVSVTHDVDSERGREFLSACKRLSAKPIMLGQVDVFDKCLDQDSIVEYLRNISKTPIDIVFTHNQLGEYGHPHHVCVHQAVKKVFKRPHFFGYNTFSDIDVKLNSWELEKKRRIIEECYPSQCSKPFFKLFEMAIERIVSPSYIESAIESSFFGRSDLWLYESTTYEIARLDRIAKEVKDLGIQSIVEVGAHEGILTSKLCEFARVTAIERSEVAVARGKVRAPLAEWIHCDFESRSHTPYSEAVLFAEVIYYFDDYKDVIRSLTSNSRFLIFQNVSKIHKRLESFMIDEGWSVIISATSNPFGLAVYKNQLEV